MAQSKQELATRNAKIRAEKLRENLAKRKQQTRQKADEASGEPQSNAITEHETAREKTLG